MVDVWYFSRWIVKACELAKQVAGEHSECYRKIRDASGSHEGSPHPPVWSFFQASGALQGARDDYAAGRLTDLRELASAEVFDDLLQAADYLLKDGWHIPAASLAGAVLEDSLRRLHRKHLGEWPGNSSISKLNDALHKAGCYEQAEWREVQFWGDIRNNADHGYFDQVDADAVNRMISDINGFIAKHTG